jgi:hypothetical protein
MNARRARVCVCVRELTRRAHSHVDRGRGGGQAGLAHQERRAALCGHSRSVQRRSRSCTALLTPLFCVHCAGTGGLAVDADPSLSGLGLVVEALANHRDPLT